MIYLIESKIPEKKSVFYSLTYIYGINKFNSFLICKKLGFSKNFKTKNLSDDQINKLLRVLDYSGLITGSSLKKFNQLNFKTLLSIKSYKGLRKNQGLPVRGQRTHTNSKTSRKQKY